MVCMVGGGAVVDDDIIDYAAESGQPCEGFIHSLVVMFGDR